jgi:hypothetical protein
MEGDYEEITRFGLEIIKAKQSQTQHDRPVNQES